MDRELEGIRKLLSDQRSVSFEHMSIVEGKLAEKSVVTATVGMGGGRSREVVSYLSGNYKPGALVCLGYAAGTTRGLDAGDLVLLSRIHLIEEDAVKVNPITSSDSVTSDPELLASARRVLESSPMLSHEGEGATVSEIIKEPPIKSRLNQELRVKAADMESYWIASEAQRKDIPFLGIRAVTDPMEFKVTDAVTIADEKGNASISRVLLHLLKRPFDVLSLLRLSRNARRATKNLTDFTIGFASSR